MQQQSLRLADNICISSEHVVKVLGVQIDDKLTFRDHISSICKKAARQLNAMARIAKYLDLDARKMVYNSFILSNFNYCPIVWHFCGKSSNKKLEKIQERALRILHNDYSSTYSELLMKTGGNTLLISRLKLSAIEVFKCLKGENPSCLNSMFHVKDNLFPS